MMKSNLAEIFSVLMVCMVFVLGCESDNGNSSSPEGDQDSDESVMENENTNVVLFAEVLPIYQAKCSQCHGWIVEYDSQVGVASEDVPEMNLIEPFDTTSSYIWHKVKGTFESVGGSGQTMPQGGDPLPETELATLQNWIQAGALETQEPGVDGDVDDDPELDDSTEEELEEADEIDNGLEQENDEIVEFEEEEAIEQDIESDGSEEEVFVEEDADESEEMEGGGEVLPPVSFSGMIQPIFNAQCTQCHSWLQSGSSYGNIVNVPSTQVSSLSFVSPGDSSNSYLYLKILGEQSTVGGSGVRMPKNLTPLDDNSTADLKNWIDQGALNN